MIIKGLIDEDFVNYKKPSMTIEFPYCSFKCDKECGQEICQNSKLAQAPNIEINYIKLVERYLNNPITKAIVMQGLEPFDSMLDVINFIYILRVLYDCQDDIVIYTGYTKEELSQSPAIKKIVTTDILTKLKSYSNIIIKYGRFIPNRPHRFDEVLGVELASDNQYAERIS